MIKESRPDYDLKIIGNNLKALRKKKGLTAEEVSEYLGIGSERTIYYYESGERVAPFDVMFALMELYDANLADVIGVTKAKVLYPFGKTEEEQERRLREICQLMNPPMDFEEFISSQKKNS